MENSEIIALVNSFITFAVGLVAYVVYLLSKRTEKSNAATILLMEIRNAESTAYELSKTIDNNYIDVRPLMPGDENWKKYQHLFASILNQDELVALNNFFECSNAIAICQKVRTEVLYTSFRAKAEVMQQVILTPDFLGKENIDKKNKYLNEAGAESYTFTPDDPKIKMKRALSELGKLSTSTVFLTLRSISEPKWYKLW